MPQGQLWGTIAGAPLLPNTRLTLTSNTPIMPADAVNQGTIYCTPYQGALIPLYDGTYWTENTFTQFSLILNASQHTSGNLYDIFAFNNSGTITLAAGPAWTNSTTRSAALASPPLNGIQVNNATITLTANGSSFSGVAANKALYLGTAYMNGNAQCTMQFKPAGASGGSANVLGLYNAYNQKRVVSLERDSQSNYTASSSSTWEPANVNNSGGVKNRITYIDGLGQSPVDAIFQNNGYNSNAAQVFGIGLLLSATSGAPSQDSHINEPAVSAEIMLSAIDYFPPTLGLQFVQAMQWSQGAGTQGWNGTGTGLLPHALRVTLDM